MRGGTVTVSWVYMVLRAAEFYGVDAEVILDAVPFDRQVLADPEGRIPFLAYLALLERAVVVTGVSDFGLQAGTFVRPNLHLTTLLVLNGPTLHAVYERMCRLSRFHWDRSNVGIETDGKLARLATRPPRQRPTLGYRHFLESRLSIWVNFGRIALGEAWVPRAITTLYEPAASREACETFFGCPVTAGGDALEVVFDRELLDRPTQRHFPPLDDALQQLSLDMLASVRRRDGFVEETRRAIVANLTQANNLSTGARARAAGMNIRTFQRRLEYESTTYAKLLEETRVRMACQYFTVSQMQLSEIAWHVGYKSPAAFDHAFRRVMDNTPSAMRAAMLEKCVTHLPTPAEVLASAEV